jgi:hypothetical protein
VQLGAVLIGVHVNAGSVAAIRDAMSDSGALRVVTANWNE